jgi:general stress protein 26
MRARIVDAHVKDGRIYVATHRTTRKYKDIMECNQATFAFQDTQLGGGEDGVSGYTSLVGHVREVKDAKHRERAWKDTW